MASSGGEHASNCAPPSNGAAVVPAPANDPANVTEDALYAAFFGAVGAKPNESYDRLMNLLPGSKEELAPKINPAARALRTLFAPPAVDALRKEWEDAAGELDDDVPLEQGDWLTTGVQVEELDEDGLPVVCAISRSSSSCILDAPGAVQVDNFTDFAEAGGGGTPVVGDGYMPSAAAVVPNRAPAAHVAAMQQFGAVFAAQAAQAAQRAQRAWAARQGGGGDAAAAAAGSVGGPVRTLEDELRGMSFPASGGGRAAPAPAPRAAAAPALAPASAAESCVMTREDEIRVRAAAGKLPGAPPLPRAAAGSGREDDEAVEFEEVHPGRRGALLDMLPDWADPSVLPEPGRGGGGAEGEEAVARADVAAAAAGTLATLPGEPLVSDSGADARLVPNTAVNTAQMLAAMGLGGGGEEEGEGEGSGSAGVGGSGAVPGPGGGGGGGRGGRGEVDLEIDLTRGSGGSGSGGSGSGGGGGGSSAAGGVAAAAAGSAVGGERAGEAARAPAAAAAAAASAAPLPAAAGAAAGAGAGGGDDSDTAVEAFAIDPDFDYDNVELTPRRFPYTLFNQPRPAPFSAGSNVQTNTVHTAPRK
ncbi:hypothetical protein FOA52_016089 [Chlamydomonas sp. UWO 241]|nr:hypothetical protein FOA52_016089 [Chlamydomonas sp. UWO 241]